MLAADPFLNYVRAQECDYSTPLKIQYSYSRRADQNQMDLVKKVQLESLMPS